MSASEAFSSYMDAWKRSDWRAMVANMQITASVYGWGLKRFKDMYGGFPLVSYVVTGEKEVSESCTHIKANLKLLVGGVEVEKSITANVICETMPYNPDPLGMWGVNPHSVLGFREA